MAEEYSSSMLGCSPGVCSSSCSPQTQKLVPGLGSLASEVPRSLRLYCRQRHRKCSRIGTQVDSVWSKKIWASLLRTKDLQSFPYSPALCRLSCSSSEWPG